MEPTGIDAYTWVVSVDYCKYPHIGMSGYWDWKEVFRGTEAEAAHYMKTTPLPKGSHSYGIKLLSPEEVRNGS